MSAGTRIYVIKPDFKNAIWNEVPLANYPPDRLIRAANAAQAARHAIRSAFSVDVAGQDDLVQLIAAGVPVETAAVETATAATEEVEA